MAITKQELIDAIKEMNVLELSELVKELEEIFGVSASAAVAVAAGPVAAAVEAAPVEEQTEFDAVLTVVGEKKINVIKTLRDLTGLGLKEAKDLVDNAPKPVKEGVSKEEAEKVKAAFEAVGATIEIK